MGGRNLEGYLRRNWIFILTCAEIGFPLRLAGSYFQFLTESTAAWRRYAGPAVARASITFPVASISAVTTTSPSTLPCFANWGYAGRVEEISFGSLAVIAEEPAPRNAPGGGGAVG